MSDPKKRKHGPDGGRGQGGPKRSKGGSGNKWQTPHAAAKSATYTPRGGSIDPGDVGIWATCMKAKEGKATIELKSLFEEYAEKLYNIKPASADADAETADAEDGNDIEESIAAELSSLVPRKAGPGIAKQQRQFQAVHIDTACVLFFKTHAPVDPVDLVTAICKDAAAGGARKSRFINRLTPMTAIGKATESGIKETARKVLSPYFDLAEEGVDVLESEIGTGCSYAIRPTIRNHSTIKRDVIIPMIAGIVGAKHKVNLTKPDKVIIVEIFQTICGMVVVDSVVWEGLRKFNLYEIHQRSEEAEAPQAVENKGLATTGQ